MKFKFYSDAGHGWLAVKRELLEQFGLLSKVTHYSYQKGETVYLEEDCDASLFIEYLMANNIAYGITQIAACEYSRIRSYPRFAA